MHIQWEAEVEGTNLVPLIDRVSCPLSTILYMPDLRKSSTGKHKHLSGFFSSLPNHDLGAILPLA